MSEMMMQWGGWGEPEDSLADRIRRRMAEFAIEPQQLAAYLHWSLEKIEALLTGAMKTLDDFDLWRLAQELRLSPLYLARGTNLWRDLPTEETSRFRTLHNFDNHVKIYELTLERAERLWRGTKELAVKRRQAMITPSKWVEYHAEILGPLSDFQTPARTAAPPPRPTPAPSKPETLETTICPDTNESCPCTCLRCAERHPKAECPHHGRYEE